MSSDANVQKNKSSIGKEYETSFICENQISGKRAKFVLINAMMGNIVIKSVHRVPIEAGKQLILVESRQVKEIEKTRTYKEDSKPKND